MKSEIAKGAAWMVLMRMCDRLLGLGSTLILARLLAVSDFGLVAMAMSFIALIELASAFSFEIALIQRDDPQREHYDTAWTLNLGFALLCALTTAALSPMAAKFYAEPRLIPLMCVLAIGWAISGFENIGIVNFRRRMDFASEFRFMFTKRVVGVVVTLIFAFMWRSYWALVIGQTVIRCVGVLLSYVMEPYRPRLSLAARKDLFSFSSWMLINNIVSFGVMRLPHFLVGRIAGPAALGMYTISYEFAHLPSTELSAPVNRALLPGFARLGDDMPALRRIFGDAMSMTYCFTFPTSLGLAMLSGPVVQVVLGEKWLAAAPILATLAIAGAIEVVSANASSAYFALGRARLVAGLNVLKLVMLMGFAMLLAPQHGAMGMALADLISSAAVVGGSVYAVMRLLDLSLGALVTMVWRSTAAGCVMAAGLYALVGSPFETPTLRPPWLLAAGIGLGALIYVVALYSLWGLCGRPEGPEKLILHRGWALLRRLMGRQAPQSVD